MKSNLPEWLTRDFFYGQDPESENDDNPDDEEGDEEDNEDESEESEDDDSEDEGDDEDDENEEEEDELEPLRNALKSERKLRREERKARLSAERERDEAVAKLSAGTEKESEVLNDLQSKLNSALSNNDKLRGLFATQALHTAIVKAAVGEKFIDPEDALSLAKDIEVDQDDEDPTRVEVDEALVLASVKSLAKKKPHLVSKKKTPEKKTTSATPRGNRPRRKSKSKVDLSHYPSLRQK